jgi:hypothetical protein
MVGLAISVFSGGRMALVRLQRSGKRLLQATGCSRVNP